MLINKGEVIADGTTDELRNMSSNRTVSATFPGGVPELSGLPGAESVEAHGNRVHITTQDSDALARYLLTETDACDLEVTSHGLEDTFLALTQNSGQTQNNEED